MSFTNYLENAILEHVFGGSSFTQLTNVYVGLSTADPGETAGSLAEPTSTGSYARINIAVADLTISANNVSNTNAESFPESTAAWSTGATDLDYFVLSDASSAGNYLGSGALTTGRAVNASGITLTFQAGELDVTLD